MRSFTTYLRRKYSQIPVLKNNISELTRHIMNKLPCGANNAIDTPILMEKLKLAVKTGKPHKAPSRDRISVDYFKIMWDVTKTDILRVMNEMFMEGKMTDAQKYGRLVCVPKIPHPRGPNDYRLLTLLNADYKLRTRIIANRLHPWLAAILNPSQHCGMQGHTVFEALATLRDAIAHAEYSKTPLSVVPLDFTAHLTTYHIRICSPY